MKKDSLIEKCQQTSVRKEQDKNKQIEHLKLKNNSTTWTLQKTGRNLRCSGRVRHRPCCSCKIWYEEMTSKEQAFLYLKKQFCQTCQPNHCDVH